MTRSADFVTAPSLYTTSKHAGDMEQQIILTLTALCVDACARRTLGLQEGDLLDMLGSCARGALSMSLLAGGRLQPRLLDLHPAWRCSIPSRALTLKGEGVGRGCVDVSVRARAENSCAGSQSQPLAKDGRMQAWRARSRSCAACASAAAARASSASLPSSACSTLRRPNARLLSYSACGVTSANEVPACMSA